MDKFIVFRGEIISIDGVLKFLEDLRVGNEGVLGFHLNMEIKLRYVISNSDGVILNIDEITIPYFAQIVYNFHNNPAGEMIEIYFTSLFSGKVYSKEKHADGYEE